MKVGYVQNSPLFGKKERNFEEIRALLTGVKADLIVLPELFATGYAFTARAEVEKLAETSGGETAEFMKCISGETRAVVVGGFIEKENGKNYNAAMLVYGGEVVNTYRKIHLFNKEKLWFTPGNKPLSIHELKGMKIGVMICFDWLFPEVTRKLALEGAQVIAHPSNLVMPYCQSAMVTRCLENRVFAVTANRTGREKRGEDDFTFTGGSQITNFDGKILLSAPKDKTVASVVQIDVAKANNKMINDYNDVLKDRRVEFYD
ncbi:MAG: nitrilase-related carbon-nitrogen hydrolase [Candidatus Micrarchaeota archaeon]